MSHSNCTPPLFQKLAESMANIPFSDPYEIIPVVKKIMDGYEMLLKVRYKKTWHQIVLFSGLEVTNPVFTGCDFSITSEQ